MKRWLIALVVLVVGRLRRRPRLAPEERIVPPGAPDRRAENLILLLFGCATLCGAAVPVVYAWDAIPNQTQFLGLALGLACAFVSAACIVIGKRLVVTEELEEDYGATHPDDREALDQLVDESGDRFTRKRLLFLAGAGAGTALGYAWLNDSPTVCSRDPYSSGVPRGLAVDPNDGSIYLADGEHRIDAVELVETGAEGFLHCLLVAYVCGMVGGIRKARA